MTLTDDVRSSWQRFLDEVEPLRPDLYRYCRHLTRSPWDAEDLVQDAMSKAFVTLATVFHEVPNRRAWLFRVASNLWIDRVRRARLDAQVHAEPDAPASDPRAAREAAGTLLSEQAYLDLEFEAFLSLCGEEKSLDRIKHMLEHNKPLRN